MAIYSTLQRGSRGDEVRKLQSSLISAGYDVGSTGADGIYGPATERAVLGYQRDKGLAVDGIAGEKTLKSLYSLPGEEEPGADAALEETYLQALRELEEVKAAKPKYENTYEKQLEALYDEMVNRAPFVYRQEADPAYRQLRDRYLRQGQLAMLDTMGQAAGLTGGYGSTYGQLAGQQAYQGYLDKLSQAGADLYAQAENRYARQGQALSDRYAILEGLSRDAYDRYQDALVQYRSDLTQSRYRANDAYDRWQDALEYELALQKSLNSKKS